MSSEGYGVGRGLLDGDWDMPHPIEETKIGSETTAIDYNTGVIDRPNTYIGERIITGVM